MSFGEGSTPSSLAFPYSCQPSAPLLLLFEREGSPVCGTGYATSIPNHNPETLIEWIRCKLAGRDLPPLQPFSGWCSFDLNF